jgi:hypothetical protein
VRDWIAGLTRHRAGAVAQVYDPGARRARQRNLEGQQQRLGDWRRRHVGDRHLRPESNQTFWGTGNLVPMFDPFYRPGDNLYTNSAISGIPKPAT